MTEATNYVSGEHFVQRGETHGSHAGPLLKNKDEAVV
jgi:hypothetical protein